MPSGIKHTLTALVVLAIPLTSIQANADEKEDREAIRDLVDREQQAWDGGDAEALLACHTKDFMTVSGGENLDLTHWAQAKVGYTYKALLKLTSNPDWSKNMKAQAAREHRAHSWEVNHISISDSGEEAVVKTQMFWQGADADAGVIKEHSHASVWMARKTNGEWQFCTAFGPIFAYNQEKPIPDQE